MLRMAKTGLFYVRFMDDIVVLAPTRWKLRKAVKAVYETLDALRLEKHPGKTFIGRVEKGFDFLGYHFSLDGLKVAEATIEKFLDRAARLYEQERERPESPSALGMYVRRWVGWASSVPARPEMLHLHYINSLVKRFRRGRNPEFPQKT